MAIIHSQGGTMFTGEDVHKFQIAALRSGLGLMAIGIKPHRSWTSLRAVLEQASRYTGQKYSGKKDIERARTDLETLLCL